jgi:hypothetical protein
VSATLSDPGATLTSVQVAANGGTPAACPAPGYVCPLAVGSNLITTTVTAADGTVKTYTITVTRTASTVVFTANDAAGVLEGGTVQIFPLANDQDLAGAGLRIVAVTAPSNGVVQVSQDAQSLTYTPAAQFSGLDFFNYTAEDGSGATSTSMVAVVVTALAQEDTPQVAVIHPTQPTTASFSAGNIAATLIVPPGAYNGVAGPLGPRDVFYIAFTEIVTPAANVEVSPAPTLSFAGKVFTLDAFFNNIVLDNYVFPEPVEFTIAYDPTQINGLTPETLQLFYWDVNTQQWSQDGLTFVSNDTVNHTITYRVAHFTEFSYFGSSTPTALEPGVEPQIDNWIYLPAVQR